MSQGWIGFDLDGTLAEYTYWQGYAHIGPPIPKMITKVKEYLQRGSTVKIFTARVSSMCPKEELPIAIKTIEDWCLKHIGQKLEITCEKDFKLIEFYDDRAIPVEFNTGQILLQNIL